MNLVRKILGNETSRINSYKLLATSQRQLASTNSSKSIEETENEPIKYSTSRASKWMAEDSRKGVKSTRLWYEPIVIGISISTFLIYFCYLREENDVDVELAKTLYSRISGLEELQLNLSLQHNEQRGLDTKAIEQRLIELRET